jgi:DNA primase
VRTVDDGALEANFACVKGAIGCEQVAEMETYLKPAGGGKLLGRCPCIDHEDGTPSFYCYPNDGGFYDSWWCYGCNRGGDVIDLYEGVMGWRREPVSTLRLLAERFGLKLWRPEDLMSDAQLAARTARRRVEASFARALRAHYFDLWVMPQVRAVEDLGEREALLERSLKEAGLAR